MNNLIKIFTIGLIIFVLTGFGAACSSLQSKNEQGQQNKTSVSSESFLRFKSDDPNSLPPADSRTRAFLGENAETVQDEASLLVGVWRMSYQGGVCMTQAEMVFQPNGGYSGYSQCSDGSYAFQTVGTWRILQSGAVRLQYSNYSPKEYLGNPIRIPDGETMYYRFLDRNRIGFSGGIIAYRVG